MTTTINNIATRVIAELKNSSIVDYDMMKCAICSVLTSVNASFDCELTYTRTVGFIQLEIARIDLELYRVIYPEIEIV